MFQYKAVLKKTGVVVAEGHTVQDVEHKVVHLRRTQKREHDGHVSEEVKIIHTQRDQKTGLSKEVLIKVIK